MAVWQENLPELNEQQLLDALLQDSPAVRIARVGVMRAEAALRERAASEYLILSCEEDWNRTSNSRR